MHGTGSIRALIVAAGTMHEFPPLVVGSEIREIETGIDESPWQKKPEALAFWRASRGASCFLRLTKLLIAIAEIFKNRSVT